MFLTKVGLLQKERKQNDARLSAPSPGPGSLAAEGGSRAASHGRGGPTLSSLVAFAFGTRARRRSRRLP